VALPFFLMLDEITPPPLDAPALAYLQALAAESMGWQPLGQGTYLHHGDVDKSASVSHVVGIPNVSLAGMNVLLLV